MITKACKQLLKTVLTFPNLSQASTNVPAFAESIRNTTNSERWVCYIDGTLLTPIQYGTGGTGGIRLGTGTTLPTENDYTLENDISSSLIDVDINAIRGTDNDLPYLKFNITVFNKTNANIVVTEAGFATNRAVCFSQYPPTGNPTTAVVLLDRTLLSQPVTITPQGVETIEYVIKVDMPFV